MADRITVTTGTVAGVQSPAGPRVARFIACGQTQFGPTDAPRVVRNLRDYLNTFGARSGGANMYDAAETFFNCGGGELVVQRAFGPSAVNATIGLDSSKIVVTSRAPGAYYNAWTAAYTSASKTLTLVKGSRTVTYTGTDAASLQSAASVDPDVTVTVSSLPASNVAATNLASGADDYANVNWTTVLGKVTPAVGPGCIAAPGVNGAASALATHAAANRRIALLTPGQTDSSATVITAQGNITAAHKQYATYVYPWVTTPDGTGGRKTIDGVGLSVAPLASARLFDTMTISGSGLFQLEIGCRPTSAPQPTEDMGWLLVKTSASGPMPTSRYCDHRPASISVALTRLASSEPGTRSRRLEPMMPPTRLRISSAFFGSPAACSSITRSTIDPAKVTPQAFTA